MPIEVELFDELDDVARDAEGRLDRDAQPSIFDRLDWYRLTLAHTPPPGRLLVLRAKDGDARAWLFLAVDGSRASALTSWYTLGYTAPASFAPTRPAEPNEAGLATLRQAQAEREKVPLLTAIGSKLRHMPIAELNLYPLAPGDPLTAAFRDAGWWVSHGRAGSNWVVRLNEPDFERYWAARPARLRHTADRKARAARLDIAIHRSFDAQAWADYETVYGASWKPAEGSPAFLRALAEQEGTAGTLRLGIARHDGTPVAAQLWLVENSIATIHKLAHAEAAKSLSPGTLLSVAMFRDVITRDCPTLIGFGTGDDAYKADWMDERRPLYRLSAFNPLTMRGLYGAGRQITGMLVRAIVNE